MVAPLLALIPAAIKGIGSLIGKGGGANGGGLLSKVFGGIKNLFGSNNSGGDISQLQGLLNGKQNGTVTMSKDMASMLLQQAFKTS